MNHKVVIVFCGIWFMVLMGLAIYFRYGDTVAPAYGTATVSHSVIRNEPSLSPTPSNELYEGGTLHNLSKPKQIIRLFIESIDRGEMANAIYLVEPNYLLKQITPGDSQKSEMDSFVRLWDKGELADYNIKVPMENAVPLPCSVSLMMKNEERIILKLDLVELNNDEAQPPVKDWYITNIRKEIVSD